jgi:hypothetical protein
VRGYHRRVKQVTRVVKAEDLRPLLEHPPRATLAFVQEGKITALPVSFRWRENRYLVGWPWSAEPPSSRVKLLVDDGPWYFDLRGVWVRGMLVAVPAPPDAGTKERWFELQPEKVAAWHYGRMREV